MRTIRGVRRLVVPLLLSSGFLAACYETDPVEPQAPRGGGFQLAAYRSPSGTSPLVAGVVECSAGARRTKTVTINVIAADGTPAHNAVVTMIDPTVVGGSRCWGYTAYGVLLATLPADAARFFTVRTEISPDAPALEIYPPAPPAELDLQWNRPSPTAGRHSPRLVSGRRCDVVTAFGWPALLSAAADPCRIGSLNSFTVTLAPEARVIHPRIVGFDGNGLEGVIIAATSAAGVDENGEHSPTIANGYCDALRSFVNRSECLWPKSHGPAFLHAMSKTDGSGTVPNGLAVGAGKIWVEAIAPLNDGTSLFGTVVNYPGDESLTLAMEPGICKVVTRPERTDNAALDLMDPVKSGVGMIFEEGTSTGIDGQENTETVVIRGLDNSLIVKLSMKANASSTGTLTFNVRYAGGSNSSRSVTFDFAVDKATGLCTAAAPYGNGLTGGAAHSFGCSSRGNDVYTAVFQIYNLQKLSSASFSAKTNPAGSYSGDSLDAQRSDLTAASQPFDLKDLTCPLQLNTDGKLIGIA